MGTVAFSTFRSSVYARAFPFGEPENLTAAIAAMVVEALIQVQRYVVCYTTSHIDILDSEYGSFTSCGTTYISRPRGKIRRVRNRLKDSDTGDSGDADDEALEQDHCRVFDYDLAPVEDVELIARDTLNMEFTTCQLRWGLFTIGKANIGIAPRIGELEQIELHWDGIKRVYGDGDLVPDDPELQQAVTYYIQREIAGSYDKDVEAWKIADEGWKNTVGEMQHDCREHGGAMTETPEDDIASALAFTFVADGGLAGASQTGVANLAHSFNPDIMLFGGDNNYPSGDPATLAANWLAYQGDISRNVVFPALGAKDLDWEDGKPQTSYFTLPGNGRYYRFRRGPVEFFCVNSGINTAAAVVEADGNTAGSVQGLWLQAALADSEADWKVVFLHHAPFTNATGYSPGTAALQWPFDTWGADVVLSGHAHNYERLVVGTLPYFVVGTGGHSLVGFIGGPTADSKKRYSADYGVLRATADRQKMLFRFYSSDGVLQDIYALNK